MRTLRELMAKNLPLWLMLVTLLSGCSSDDDVDSESDSDSDSEYSLEAVEWIDENLSTYYLYNDEYNAMERDFTLGYYDFLNTTLLNMSTNVLDKKYYETIYNLPYYDYMLYSYVTCEETTKSRATLDSRYGTGFGFVSTELVSYNDSIAIAVHGVYEGSPVAELGISRGDVITSITGQTIDVSNYYFDLLYMLLDPSDGDQITFTINSGESYTVDATTIEVNPILHSEVIEESIGYVVYSLFDSNFDDDLVEVFQEFSDAGVSDLILDLRLNPGGYVSSAQKLSSMIGGSYTTGKVFAYYRMNDDLTNDYTNTSKIMGMSFDSSVSAFYSNFTTPSATLALSSPKIYCLVSESTASASELLINSLRGVGFDVVLIGTETEGKNVGMITLNESFSDGYEYDLLPITFENFNCNMEGGYEDGMVVDYEVNDLTGFVDYGADEPLVAKALELITGRTLNVGETRSSDINSLTSVGGKMSHRNSGGSLVELQR